MILSENRRPSPDQVRRQAFSGSCLGNNSISRQHFLTQRLPMAWQCTCGGRLHLLAHAARYARPMLHEPTFQRVGTRNNAMRKTLPDSMFGDPERSRLTMRRTWVLDNEVTEIEMNERQFWNFAQLQPVAEQPWG